LHDRRPQLERRGEAVVARVEQQEIEAERLVGLATNALGALADLLGSLTVTAERAKAARIGHGGNEFGRRRRAHAAERDGMLDAQQIADRRWQHAVLPWRPVSFYERSQTRLEIALRRAWNSFFRRVPRESGSQPAPQLDQAAFSDGAFFAQ
jgi:hypothetical protein